MRTVLFGWFNLKFIVRRGNAGDCRNSADYLNFSPALTDFRCITSFPLCKHLFTNQKRGEKQIRCNYQRQQTSPQNFLAETPLEGATMTSDLMRMKIADRVALFLSIHTERTACQCFGDAKGCLLVQTPYTSCSTYKLRSSTPIAHPISGVLP